MNEYHLTVSHAFSKTLSGLWSPKVDISRTNIFHSSLELFKSQVESPKNGVPNRISYQNFQLESPKRKVESPMFFKKFSWESPVCFVKMVLDIIFRFPWTHLSSPYHIRHLSEVESDIWKKTFLYTKTVFQNDVYTSP